MATSVVVGKADENTNGKSKGRASRIGSGMGRAGVGVGIRFRIIMLVTFSTLFCVALKLKECSPATFRSNGSGFLIDSLRGKGRNAGLKRFAGNSSDYSGDENNSEHGTDEGHESLEALPEIPRAWMERRPQKTCRKTQIYPFHVGCPRNCSVLRPDLAASELYDTNQLERSGIVWWTGHYGGYDSVWPLSAWGISRNISISPEFVHTYASAEETLIDMLAQKKDTKNLSIKRGHNIHIALSYFCCWTPEELEKARDIIAKWIKSLQVEGRGEGHGKDDKDIMVNFDRLSCYQERENSVTVIIEADSISQRRLLKMNREMKQKLIEEGIPVVLDRTEQIPFHATLLNIYEENDNTSSHLATPSLNLYEAKSSDDEVAAGVNSMSNNTGAQLKTPAADAKGRTTPDLISPYLPFIAKAVKDVDTYFENRWTMRNPVKIPIVEATQRCGEGNTKGSSPSRADSKWAAECLKP